MKFRIPAAKPLVSKEDDPIFDADHAACAANTRDRRAQLTVADIESHDETWRR
jgi:hypothetical protein